MLLPRDIQSIHSSLLAKTLFRFTQQIMNIMSLKRKTSISSQHKSQVKKPEKESKTLQDSDTRSNRFFATDEVMKTKIKPEKNASRLTHALEEINRRLLSQQLVWFSL